MDNNTIKRTDYPDAEPKNIIIIDHHPITAKTAAGIRLIDTKRASCTELVLELFLK